MRLGNRALRRALVEAAHAAARTTKVDQGYLRGRYRRLIVRCGAKKAAVAIGHTILRIVYHVLNEQEAYREPVLIAHDERRRAQTQRRAIDQLAALGYAVTITPMTPAA